MICDHSVRKPLHLCILTLLERLLCVCDVEVIGRNDDVGDLRIRKLCSGHTRTGSAQRYNHTCSNDDWFVHDLLLVGFQGTRGPKLTAVNAGGSPSVPSARLWGMSNRRALVARCYCRTCAPGADTYKTSEARRRHRRPRNSGPSTRPQIAAKTSAQEIDTLSLTESQRIGSVRQPTFSNRKSDPLSRSVRVCSAKKCDSLAFFG